MAKIHKLPQNLINLIAAGEVVERPSSVVKELLENSIDAGAKKIIVNIEEFGTKLIQVKDDGVGMNQEDALLALEQHATSKIITKEDLEAIGTLGFRGEALASISSVSERVVIETKSIESDSEPIIVEYKSNVEKGLKSGKGSQSQNGTTISIHNLFKNIPARKKFLKAETTELKHIISTFIEVALPHISIHFELNHNGKLIHRLTSTPDYRTRIFEIWGKNMANGLFENRSEKIDGLISKTENATKSKPLQYLFINNRFVKSPLVIAAINEAYHGFIHRDLKPNFFIFLKLDPKNVDVNVHPRKLEVKFENDREIFSLVHGFIRKTLETSSKEALHQSITNTRNIGFIGDLESKETDLASTSVSDPTSDYTKALRTKDEPRLNLGPKSHQSSMFNDRSTIGKNYRKSKINEAMNFTGALFTSNTESEVLDEKEGEGAAFEPQNLMQIFNTYIVFENNRNRIIFVDQHAAAEKIAFEKLLKDYGSIKTKPLLVPEIVEFRNSAEKEDILKKKELLNQSGVVVEDFGSKAIQVIEVPDLLKNPDIQTTIDEILHRDSEFKDTYEASEVSNTISQEQYIFLATLACHGSIRAGQKLSYDEMKRIVTNLLKLENPYNCPHGRPVMWELSRTELEKNFKRKI